MKNVRLLSVLIFFISSLSFLTGQTDTSFNWQNELMNPEADFYKVYNAGIKYYEQNENASGQKSFARWSSFWKPRLGVNSSNVVTREAAFDALTNVLNETETETVCSYGSSKWNLLGPVNSIPTPLSTNLTATGMGIVVEVEIDNQDPTQNTIYIGTNASGIWKTTNAESNNPTWVNITNSTRLPALGIQDILLVEKNNSKVIYAATGVTSFVTSGYGIGVIKSENDGVSWEKIALSFSPLTDKIPCRKLVVHPDNPDVIYALCRDRVYKTTDGFQTVSWINEEFDPSIDNCNPDIGCIANQGLACGIPNEGIFSDMKFHPTNSNIIYLSKSTTDKVNVLSQILVSIDGGIHWCSNDFNDFGLPENPDLFRMDVLSNPQPGDENILVLGAVNSDGNLDFIITSDNSGNTFNAPISSIFSSYNPDGYKNGFAISPTNPDLIYWGGIRFHRSMDGGANFDRKSNPSPGAQLNDSEFMHDDIRTIKVILDSNNNEKVYVGNDGGLSMITDPGGQATTTWNWNTLSRGVEGLNISQFYGFGLASDYSYLVGGCQDLSRLRSDFRTKEWSCLPGYGDGAECVIDPSNVDRVIGQLFNSIAATRAEESTNRGDQFVGFINDGPGASRPMEIDQNGTVYVGYDEVVKRELGGNQVDVGTMPIVICPNGDIDADPIQALAVAPSDNNVIYAARANARAGKQPCADERDYSLPATNKFFVTENANDNQVVWHDIGQYMFNTNYQWWELPTIGSYTLNHAAITDIAVDPQNAKRVWVSLDRFDSDLNGNHNVVAFSEIGGKPEPNDPFPNNAFIDMTGNLPDFPANAIIYQAGTPDYVYLGTDVGVWVNRNASNPNSPWECFNKNLPVTIVTDLEINECAGKIVASTFGNGIWEADLLAPPAQAAKIVGTSVLWDTDRDVFHDLIIESGKTLTIQSKVNMGGGRKIIVEPGAKLILEGGAILTNDCNVMWGGIEVWGDPNAQFSYSTHGFLHVKSGSVIEHAVDAIQLYNSGHLDGTDEITHQGGIVVATNSTFINNQRSFDMVNYGFDTSSELYRCNFNIDDDFRGELYLEEDFDAHITITEARGLLIRESNFSNNKTNTTPCVNGNCKGEGIRTLDGGFEVKNSNFIGFDKGVYAGNTLETSTFSVTEGSLFRDNFVGIQVEGVNNFKVTEAIFEVGGYDIVATPDIHSAHLGLVNIGGTGFIIEENDFIEAPIATNNPNKITFGTWIHDSNLSNSYANDIYRNDFQNLEVANLGSGKNRYSGHHGIGFGGLEYLCNGQEDMSNNLYDFVVGDEGVAPIQGSTVIQGNTFSAGNNFTSNAPNNFWHFFNDGGDIEYRYLGINPNSPDFNYTVNTMDFVPATQASFCYTRLGEPNEPDKVKGMLIFNDHESSFISSKNNLESLLNGGSTNNLLIEVSNVTNGNASILKNTLLDIAPFVSEEVLQVFANRTDIYSQNDIYDVLVANPEVASQTEMIDFLVSKSTPMPDDLISNLIANTQYKSERGEIDNQLHYHYKMMNFGADLVLHALKQDSLGVDIEAIKTWISNKSNELPQYDFIEVHLGSGDINTAQQLLNSIPQTYDLEDSQLDQYNSYQTLKNIQANLKTNNRTWLDLEENDLDNLKMLAEGDDFAAIQAKLILNHGYRGNYRYIPELPNQVSQTFMITPPVQQNGLVSYSLQKVYAFPNPANEKVFFKYNLEQEDGKANLYIRDLDGKVLKEFQLTERQGQVSWNTESIHSGVYIYNISINGKDLESQKIVIVK